jgi:hypothetical protein
MPSRITHIGEGQNQNLSRKVKLFFDQHKQELHPLGRAWWGYTEKQADGSDSQPIAELMPVHADMELDDGTPIRGWSAPWYPEPKYIALAVSGLAGSRFRIDYIRMQRDYEQANRDYYDRANNEAFSKGWDPIPLYGKVPYVIRALKHVGSPPKSPKLPTAALAGDRWLLGFSDEVNERLLEVIATDNGRLALTPEYDEEPVRGQASGLSASDQAELLTLLRAQQQSRKQAKVMRDAKQAKSA